MVLRVCFSNYSVYFLIAYTENRYLVSTSSRWCENRSLIKLGCSETNVGFIILLF